MEKWHAAKPKSILNGSPTSPAIGERRREGRPAAAAVHAGVRRGARARMRTRRAGRGHHRRDELRHRAEHPAEGDARALLRRRHRRAAGRAVRERAVAAGDQAGRRGLLDVPAARLRPDRPRRLPAEARRRLRDGPRGARGRRRPDPPRRLRHRLHALPAEPRADGTARRGDADPDAADRDRPRRPDRAALPARRGRRRGAARAGRADRDRDRRDPRPGRSRRPPSPAAGSP